MREIQLSQGKVALVSDRDYPALSKLKWTAQRIKRRWYAVRYDCSTDPYEHHYMHRDILRVPSGVLTDHRDGDGLNNRRSNIRACTALQNSRSFKRKKMGASSRFRGVGWRAAYSNWRAYIRQKGRAIHLGTFGDEVSAAVAYNAAARKMFGKFASLNRIPV